MENTRKMFLMTALKRYSILLSAISVFVFSASWHNNGLKRFTWDDAYILMSWAKTFYLYGKPAISLYHENLLGITAPLYAFILTVLYDSSLEIFELKIRILNFIFGICSVTLFYLIILNLFEERISKYVSAIGGSLLFSYHAQMSFIANSGMETGLHIFLFLANIYIYIRRIDLGYLGLLNIASLLVRPDSVIMIFLFSVMILLSKSYAKPEKLRYFTVVVLGMSFYFALFYFATGHAVPNTAGAKYHFFLYSCMNFMRKFDIFSFSYLSYAKTLIWIIVLSAFSLRISKSRVQNEVSIFLVSFFFLHSISTFTIMPDGPTAYQGRYFALVFAVFALLSAFGLETVFTLLLKIWNNQPFAYGGVILIIILSMQSMNSERKRLRNFHKSASDHHQNLYEQALYVQKNTPKEAVITATDLGIIAYASERKVIDLVGLGNPEVYHYYADNFGKCIPNENRNLTDIIKKFKVNYLLVAKPWDKDFMGGYVDKLKNEIELIDNKGYDLYRVK